MIMRVDKPDFYLTAAGEYDPLAAPRTCWKSIRLRNAYSDEHLAIEIEPGVVDPSFGLGDHAIKSLIVTSKQLGKTIFPISECPHYVYVSRILDPSILESREFNNDQIEIIAWAKLYLNREDALREVKHFARLDQQFPRIR